MFREFIRDKRNIYLMVLTSIVLIFLLHASIRIYQIDKELNELKKTIEVKSQPVITQNIIDVEKTEGKVKEPVVVNEVKESLNNVGNNTSETSNIEWVSSPYQYSTKTYMSYTAITNRSSAQYRLIQNELIVCDDGFLRDKDGYIAVALGSYFGDIGSRWVFKLDDGKLIKTIKTDNKQNIHTNSTNMYGTDNGDIIEFVIDTKSSKMKRYNNGFIYGGNFNNHPDFKGKVVAWYKVD